MSLEIVRSQNVRLRECEAGKCEGHKHHKYCFSHVP